MGNVKSGRPAHRADGRDPWELELNETTKAVLVKVEKSKPQRAQTQIIEVLLERKPDHPPADRSADRPR